LCIFSLAHFLVENILEVSSNEHSDNIYTSRLCLVHRKKFEKEIWVYRLMLAIVFFIFAFCLLASKVNLNVNLFCIFESIKLPMQLCILSLKKRSKNRLLLLLYYQLSFKEHFTKHLSLNLCVCMFETCFVFIYSFIYVSISFYWLPQLSFLVDYMRCNKPKTAKKIKNKFHFYSVPLDSSPAWAFYLFG